MAKFYSVDMRHVLSSVIDTEYDALRDYVVTVEEALKEKYESFSIRVARRAEGMSPEAQQRYFEDLAQDASHLGDRFPALTWQTAFISAYSIFEHHLLNLCGHAARNGKFSIVVKDIKGSGIEVGQKYLKKVCKVNFPDGNQEWDDIVQMNQIRNIFVHRLGRMHMEPIPNGLLNYQRRKAKLIEFISGDEIRVQEGYCIDAIETFRRVFKSILAAVPDELLRQSYEI